MAANAGAIRAGKAFVEFFLKDGPLRKGLAKLDKRFTAIGGKLQSVGKMFLGVGAAMAAGFGAALTIFAKVGSNLNDMAARTGLSVEALGELGYAAKQNGASLEAVEKGARGMARMLLSAENGSAAAVETLNDLNLSFEELNGLAPEEQFTAIAKGIASVDDPTKRAALAMKAFGKSGVELLPMLETLEETREAARRLGLVMSTEDAAAADALGDATDTLWAQLSRVFQTIAGAVAGPLTEFLVWSQGMIATVIEWIQNNHGLIQTVALVAAGVVAAGAAIFAVGAGFTIAGAAAGVLATAIGVVTAVVGFLVSPLGLIITLVAGVVTAFATMTETGVAMTSQLVGWFAELWAIASTTFEAISAALAAGDIQAAATVLWSALNLLWLQGTQGLRETWHSAIGSIVKIWHTAWAGMAQLGNSVWGNLQRGWSHTAQFFGDLWDMTVAGMKRGLNELVGWFQKAWAWITGASDAELAKIDAEIDAKNAKIASDRDASIIGRGNAATADRTASADAQAAVLDQIGADLAAQLAGTDDGTQDKINAAQARLDEARAAWGDANQAAIAAGDAAKVEEKKAAAVGGAIAANSGGAAKVTSSGSFSADAAALMIRGGGSTDEKILKVEEEALATLNRIERKSAGGGLKAGP